MEEKKILERLLIDKKQKLEIIVDKAKNLLGIDKDTGEILIKVPRTELNDKQLIGLYMVGKYFSKELGLVDACTVTSREIMEKLAMDYGVAAARLSDLKKERIIRSVSRGEYEIFFPKIEPFLEEIMKSAESK